MTGLSKGFVVFTFLCIFGRKQTINAEMNDHGCDIYGYNYDTKYVHKISTENEYLNVYKYKADIKSSNKHSISLINIKQIARLNNGGNICQYKSTQLNSKIYIFDDKMIMSVYDMNNEIYYENYVNVRSNIECNTTQICIASDNINNMYAVCGINFYYYSSDINKWIKGNHLQHYYTKPECGYGGNKFYVFNREQSSDIEYINTDGIIRANEFNTMSRDSLVVYVYIFSVYFITQKCGTFVPQR